LSTTLVELRQVTKVFPGVKALDRVSLRVNAGEILALVGENGAGKSTLMKVMSGTYPHGSFTGEIFVGGTVAGFRSTVDAENAGIAIIHQELSCFAHLSVAENLYVGHWPNKNGLVDWDKLHADASVWLRAVGCDIDPASRMGELPVGQQQMVEIAKALSKKSNVLILDEPTSALTPVEVTTLFSLIRTLRQQGKGLIYISHKMEEIYQLADRITVLRDGQSVHTSAAAELSEDKLIMHMVGRPLTRLFPEKPQTISGEFALEVADFQGTNSAGRMVFGPVTFQVRRGEIIGFAGLLGSGRSETLQGLFGDPLLATKGELKIAGRAVRIGSPRMALREGLAFVAEDRKRDSILPARSLEENVSIARLVAGHLLRFLKLGSELRLANAALKKLATRSTGSAQEIQQLSGGNQQKVILARALETEPQVILLDEPTRGVDVGAKYEIYEILFKLAQEGRALVVVSSDLPELMALADRIIVLRDGRQTGQLKREEFSQEAIMTLAVKG
jgi:ABC-type sugar transport system ATPase subunit